MSSEESMTAHMLARHLIEMPDRVVMTSDGREVLSVSEDLYDDGMGALPYINIELTEK